MNAPDLRAVAVSATASAALLEHTLKEDTHTPDETERILFHLSRYHRAAGIARLLTEADGTAFRFHLTCSGEARRRLLQWVTGGRRPPSRFTATGHYGPLCDALAAGPDELARDIARLSWDVLVTGHEYEEDFFYARLLGLLALDVEALPARAQPLLDALERSLEGQDGCRFAMGQALVARHQGGFDTALEAQLTEHEHAQNAKSRTLAVRDEHSETERYICVEGLALLRLARRRGLTVQPELPFLPGLARLP